jgi:hypothetical protein
MVNKIDLSDVTFLFPMRIDTIERLENLMEVIRFIRANCETNVHIIEASAYHNKLLSQLLPETITYTFIEDYDTIFYRTKYINQLVKNAHYRYSRCMGWGCHCTGDSNGGICSTDKRWKCRFCISI